MIRGIGTDLCDVRRVEAMLARRGERFAEKVLAERELAQYRARAASHASRGPRFLATRFAAKEAFSKAIGLGVRPPMTWHDCEIVNAPNGAPSFALHGALAEWFAAHELKAHLSLSDETDVVAAFVVVESLMPASRAAFPEDL
jgi:holo-[acyl-carrier-protein] synthase